MESTPLLVQRRVNTTTSDHQPVAITRPGAIKQRTVLIDAEGNASYTSLRKQALVSELQLRHRDIRALEPGVALPYPAAIFIRKQALILNLEGLKLIISKDKTLVISVPLLSELSSRSLPELSSPVVMRLASQIAMKWDSSATDGGATSGDELVYMQQQPYELRALEAALFTMVKILDTEVTTIEGMTHPVLARIRRHVERADLELLYETQNKLNKLVSRVTKIKEVLEELLDDPEEMAGMCLTRADLMAAAAAARERANSAGPSSPYGGSATATSPPVYAGGQGQGDAQQQPTPFEIQSQSVSRRGQSTTPGTGLHLNREDSHISQSQYDLQAGVSTALEMQEEEESELEDMIEAHWLQVDSILSRLSILQERITNTEHLVNLDLDAKRNSLVALGLLTDLLMLVLEAHMLCTGIFGMNLTSGLEPWQPWSLWGIVAFGLVFGTSLAVSIYRAAKSRGLLFLPSFGLLPTPGPNAA